MSEFTDSLFIPRWLQFGLYFGLTMACCFWWGESMLLRDELGSYAVARAEILNRRSADGATVKDHIVPGRMVMTRSGPDIYLCGVVNVGRNQEYGPGTMPRRGI